MREATLAASLVIDFVGYMERQGHAAADLCRAAGVDASVTSDPGARVPASVMERLWATGEQLTGDSNIGLHTAESYNPGALSILGYVMLSCCTTGEVLDRLSRYAPLLNEGLRVTLTSRGGETICQFGASERVNSFLHQTPRQTVETLAAGIVVTLKRMATTDVEPLLVTFRHPAPPLIAEHRRIFGHALRFSQAENTVVYSSAAMSARILSADPALLEVFEADARRRIAQLEQVGARGVVSGRILHLLGSRLKGEVPPLSAIASELAMSERSIQRSLRDESTSYRELIDEVRKELALQHLKNPNTTATDVAFLLGFSEPSAFTRAFRRWTGAAPTQFRSAEA